MKERISVLLLPVLAAVMLLGGCMSEPREPSGPNPGGDASKVTFALPTVAKAPATYADAVGAENDLDYINIFMFDSATGTLELIYDNDQIAVDKTLSTATIDVTERTGDKEFFFVGNGAAISTELGLVKFGETTVGEFLELICDKQDALPATPLLMTGRTTIANVENVATADPNDLKVTLLRRVARFDVDNTASVSNFSISKIYLTDVSKQAYFFGDATGVPARTIVTENAAPVDFAALTGANAGVVKAAFYTYPTTVGQGKTRIGVEGSFRGSDTKMYYLDGDYDILANTCYTLKVTPVAENEVELEVKVADWDDASEITGQPESNLVEMSEVSHIDGPGIFTGGAIDGTTTYDVSSAVQPSILRFSTKAYRSTGTKVTLDYVKGVPDDLPVQANNPAPVLTYAGAYYLQEYQIDVPVKFTTNDVEIHVAVENVHDPIQTEYFRIVRSGRPSYRPQEDPTISLPGVFIDQQWWAPVNVGATAYPADAAYTHTLANNGKLFQWGRSYFSCYPGDGQENSYVNGPQTEEAARTTYADRFIRYNATNPRDWLSPQNHNLWKGENRQGPCPDGWRVPTTAELAKLRVRVPSRSTFVNSQLRIQSDIADEYLWMQLAGQRAYNGTTLYQNHGSYGNYWSCDNTTNVQYGDFLQIQNHVATASGQHRAYAYSVRCILDTTN